jgi:hypothetical protein
MGLPPSWVRGRDSEEPARSRPENQWVPDPEKGRRAKFWARGGNVYYRFHFPQPLFA